MIKKCINHIMKFIINESKSEDIYFNDRIRYGLEVILSEGIKLIFLLIVSIILHRVIEFLLITALIIGVRTKVGGAHCKSFISCFIKSTSVYLILYILSTIMPRIPIVIQLGIVIAILAIIITSKYKTKLQEVLDDKKVIKLKIRTSLVFILIYILTLLTNNTAYVNVVLLFGIYIGYENFQERRNLLC